MKVITPENSAFWNCMVQHKPYLSLVSPIHSRMFFFFNSKTFRSTQHLFQIQEISNKNRNFFTQTKLILKTLESQFEPLLWFFQNCIVLVLSIIKSHVFPENFTEIPQVVQKIWRFSLSKLAVFISFYQFFLFFYFFFLVIKKLMMSAYNRWCQHFFHFQDTLNRLFNNCV